MPVVSTVTLTSSGRSTPAASMARRAPMTAAFACSRSCAVSTRTASTPPAIIPSTCVRYASRSAANGTWPSDGQLGPRADRAEHPPRAVRRGPAVGDLAGEPAPASASSPIRSAMPYSPRFAQLAPKVLVSTQSDADARSRRRGRERTTSGRVTLRISLQPSWPSKSSRRQVGGLQHRAHRAVGDDDALGQRLPQASRCRTSRQG